MIDTIADTVTRSTPVERRPATSDAAAIVTLTHLSWLVWVIGLATAAYAVVIACVIRWGSVDTSLWQPIVAGWQRWVVLAAGVTTTTSLLRMFVRNGATRGLLSTASTIAMTVIALAVTAWIVAGFAVERWIFDRHGWPQEYGSAGELAWSDLGRLAIESPLVLAASVVSGWLIGIGFVRLGTVGGIALIVPSMIPLAVVELTGSRRGLVIDVLRNRLGEPPLALSVAAGVAVVVAGVAVARVATRQTALG